MCVLDDVNAQSLIHPGHESSDGSAQLIRRWVRSWDLSLGHLIGEEKS